jgi:hypothetical protein
MPPKAASTSLSDREMQLLHNYLRCMKTKPEVCDHQFTHNHKCSEEFH